MRQFEHCGKSEALAANGMAATSHPLATLAAVEVLREGGNAVDAAICASAVLAVVEPAQTGLGGDCFALLKREHHKPIAINGSGFAPGAIRPDFFLERKIASISPHSPEAVTVPGAVGAWEMLLRDHGSFDLARLLRPAIGYAESGFPVSERVARDWARQRDKLALRREAREVFLSDGATPQVGDRFVQPALAKALKSIAEDGAEVFYRGWIAEDIVGTLKRLGGLHERDDFLSYRPSYEDPLAVAYRDFLLWECAPNGQGVTALTMAALLNKSDVSRNAPLSAERLHLFAEIARLAYAERDAYLCDPQFASYRLAELLAEPRIAAAYGRIRPGERLGGLEPAPLPEHKDTTYLSVVDRDLTTVSFINSIFDDFGSGIVAPESGILLHNRGCGFATDPLHPNAIGPRKRPLHTIIPALLTKQGEAVLSFGVTGGHFQPLGQMQILTNIVDYGMGIQQAIDYPRWFARGETFEIESTVPRDVVLALRALGHAPVPAPNPIGTAQAVWIDRERGVLRGGADGRRDGIALGY